MPTGPDLIRRFEQIAAGRTVTEDTWQQIADNLLGRRDFQTIRTAGEQRMQRLYDDTAKVSGGLLAGAMHSLLTSPAMRWFGLKFEDEALNDLPESALWLHAAERAMYAAFNRPESGFHAQLAELYVDLIFFGTAGLFIEDVTGEGVRFSARPLGELYLSENAAGRVDTVFRKFRLTARQAVELFGARAQHASRDLDKTPEQMREYLHAVLRNGDQTVGKVDVSGMGWLSFLVSMEDRSIVSEGSYHEFPYAIARWQKDAGETYGRGPGWDALSDQKMLNEMKKVTLKAGQKAVDPPLLIDSEGVLPSQLRIQPGGVIPINAVSAILSPPVQPLQTGMDFNISVQLIADTRRQVQEAFQHQLIEMIRDPRMTATQVLELTSVMQRHLAPILGRQQTELLEPVIERTFAIEVRAGRMPAVPAGLEGADLRVEYVSPVARAQKASDARAIIDWTSFGANLAQVDPGVLDVMDADAAYRELGDALGVPPTVVRGPEEIARRRAAAAEIARERDLERQAQVAATVASKTAKALPAQAGAAPA